MNTLNFQQESVLVSFIEDPNYDQFIDLIRGENDCFVDNQLLSCPAFNINVYDPTSTTISSFPAAACFVGEEEVKVDHNSTGGTNSATSTTNDNIDDAKPREKFNRSKALISERRRRGCMKDKLYALRALVPNITKMDKASIIGDATSYVHDLQAQGRKLKDEIAELEASLLVSQNHQQRSVNNNNVQVLNYNNQNPICKKIIQIDMVQVEERGYYTKILCKKGERVAPSLYKALESQIDFNVHNSNLATVGDNFLLTFILINVQGGCDHLEINLPNLKLWVASALLNQGFEFMQFFHA